VRRSPRLVPKFQARYTRRNGLRVRIVTAKPNTRFLTRLNGHDVSGLFDAPGRRHFVQLSAEDVERYDRGYAVALCDVDHFKSYNDSCGHLAGDDVLRSVAGALNRSCRRGDAVYRYGGEELLVLLPGQEIELAIAAGERMRQAVEALGIPHPLGEPSDVVTVSVGVAARDHTHAGGVSKLLSAADDALYRAKNEGRNRVAAGGLRT
jgi:diguanylate cyclase (GGDEF)-like protein